MDKGSILRRIAKCDALLSHFLACHTGAVVNDSTGVLSEPRLPEARSPRRDGIPLAAPNKERVPLAYSFFVFVDNSPSTGGKMDKGSVLKINREMVDTKLRQGHCFLWQFVV